MKDYNSKNKKVRFHNTSYILTIAYNIINNNIINNIIKYIKNLKFKNFIMQYIYIYLCNMLIFVNECN